MVSYERGNPVPCAACERVLLGGRVGAQKTQLGGTVQTRASWERKRRIGRATARGAFSLRSDPSSPLVRGVIVSFFQDLTPQLALDKKTPNRASSILAAERSFFPSGVGSVVVNLRNGGNLQSWRTIGTANERAASSLRGGSSSLRSGVGLCYSKSREVGLGKETPNLISKHV